MECMHDRFIFNIVDVQGALESDAIERTPVCFPGVSALGDWGIWSINRIQLNSLLWNISLSKLSGYDIPYADTPLPI